MPDLIKFKVQVDCASICNDGEKVIFREMEFVPNYSKDNNIIIGHTHKCMGWRLKLFGNELSVSGSLHKYFERINGGSHNHTDFHFSKVKIALVAIVELLNIDIYTARIHYLESGVNVESIIEPKAFLKTISSFKINKLFYDMVGGRPAKFYGKKSILSQYSIKLYNKSFESKQRGLILNRQIIRIEIVYSRTAPISHRIKYLSDLLEVENFIWLKEDLINKVKQIEFIDSQVDTSCIPSKERMLYYSGLNPDFWIDESLHNSKSVHNLKSKFRGLSNKVQVSTDCFSYKGNLLSKIKEKVEELVSN